MIVTMAYKLTIYNVAVYERGLSAVEKLRKYWYTNKDLLVKMLTAYLYMADIYMYCT